MVKKILAIFILSMFLLGNISECFARGSSGGGRSSSFSSSRSTYSSFSSSRSVASSISRPSNSWLFSKPVSVVTPKPSVRTNISPRVNIYKPSTTKVVRPRTIVKTKTVHRNVYHHSGSPMTDFMTTALFLDMLSDNDNSEEIMSEIRKNVDTMRAKALKCYDAGGGKSCITDYVR